MAQVILTNWTIYFADDAPAASSGYKQIRWTGGGGPEANTNTVNELYSELMHYFSISANIDANDTTPMRAVTPTLYQIGRFDAGDEESWFIDPDSVKHLTGGGIVSVGWERTATNAGILKVPYTAGVQFVDSDIGRAVSNSTATGTLLWYDTINSEAWIRPTDETSTHDWAGPAGTISVTSGTGSVTQNGAATSGEREWTNIKTIGSLQSNTRVYIAQDNVLLSNFWGNGNATTNHVDRLILFNDGFDSGVIDSGFLTVYARQYSKSYDHFIVDASVGGSVSVPLSTQDDLNNTSGYNSISVSTATGVFAVDEVVNDVSGATGVVTLNTGSPTTSFEYYLIGDLTDFTDTEALTGSIVGANGTVSGASSSVGPALDTINIRTADQFSQTFAVNTDIDSLNEEIDIDEHFFVTGNVVLYDKQGGSQNTGLTDGNFYYVNVIASGTPGRFSLHPTKADAIADTSRQNLLGPITAETHRFVKFFDLDEDSAIESFSFAINGQGLTLSEIYERLKWQNRRGNTDNVAGTGSAAEQYIGIDYRVDYNTLTGTITTGNTLTQALANGDTLTSIVVHHNDLGDNGVSGNGYLMLRDTVNAPFDTGASAANLQIDGSNYVTMTAATTTEAVTPTKASPFGTFAGGTFFGARGVFLENVDASESNNMQLVTDGGFTQTPPITVTFQFSGLVTNTEVRLFKDSDDTEVSGVENSSTTFSYQYEYSSDIGIYAIIHHVDYVWQKISGLTLTNANQTIPVQQQFDRNFSNP